MAVTGGTVLIEVSPGETRAATLADDGRLVGLEVERLGDPPVTGAVRLGRVTRVEPGMGCLLYTSPSPRDRTRSRMPSSA